MKNSFRCFALVSCAWLVLFLTNVKAQIPAADDAVTEPPTSLPSEKIDQRWYESLLRRLRSAPASNATTPQSGRKPDPPKAPAPSTAQLPVLTLDDVLRIVTQNHPKLRGVDAQRRIAAEKRLEKQGAFDPVFVTGSDWLRFNS
ncbi:MAG TPA: hypothetical protein VFZ34_24215, partial [Blastocatellia bacterium]|nr:hypothetical protein [Blastocatellia bacterium]